MKKIYNILFFLLLFTFGCIENLDKYRAVDYDLDKIKKRGKLIAITGYNSYSYFIYRGETMGYEYELIKRFADHLNLKLEIKIEKNIDRMIEMLNKGEGDIIAYNMTVTSDRINQLSFSDYHNLTSQVLIQRKPKNWRDMMEHEIESSLIRNPINLDGKKVYVRAGSAYKQRLLNLSKEIGGHINIIQSEPDLSTDDLIQMVSEGKIDYTIADEHVARLNHIFYPNIDYDTKISLTQKIAWATRKNADSLLSNVNSWIGEMKNTSDYYVIFNKYFKRRNVFKSRGKLTDLTNFNGKISPYDELIKKFAKTINWDWRIIASLVYQESKFDPEAKSWVGALGLMQLMPSTLQKFDVQNAYDPIENLNAGMKYLKYLDNFWLKYINNQDERIKLVLASYNIGVGHILDAYKLAKKYCVKELSWENNISEYLLNKSKAKYYNDEVVTNGYCSGLETVAFVESIFERFEHYKKVTDYQKLTTSRQRNSKG